MIKTFCAKQKTKRYELHVVTEKKEKKERKNILIAIHGLDLFNPEQIMRSGGEKKS